MKIRTLFRTKKLALWGYFLVGGLAALVILPFLILAYSIMAYNGRAFPGVRVAGMDVSGLTKEQIITTLRRTTYTYIDKKPVTLRYETTTWQVQPEDLGYRFNVEGTAAQALTLGTQGSLVDQLRQYWELWRQGKNLPLLLTRDDAVWTTFTASMAANINKEPIPPEVTLITNAKGKQVEIMTGETGKQFDEPTLSHTLEQNLAELKEIQTNIPVTVTGSQLSPTQQAALAARAEQLLNKKLQLTAIVDQEEFKWELTAEHLISFVDPFGDYKQEKITAYLNEVATTLKREPQNAKFEFDTPNNRVIEFVAAKKGLTLEVKPTTDALVQALQKTL